MLELDELPFNNLFKIEEAIAKENDTKRYGRLDFCIRGYFKELRREDVEYGSLFDYKDTTLITEENYIAPNEEITYSHGIKNSDNNIEEIIEEYEIDDEILKELL